MPSIGHNPSDAAPHGAAASQHANVRPRSLQGVPSSGSPRGAEASVHKALLALAARPAYGITLALAGTIARSWHLRGMRQLPLLALDADTTYRLLSSHFPGIRHMMGVAWGELQVPRVFDEASGLVDLVGALIENRTVVDEDSTWLAHAVATGCLEDGELWRDMNLASAAVLDDLLHDFFTTLAVRNRARLPWKQFFRKELEARAEKRLCMTDGSGAIPDYARCFGHAAHS